MKKLVVDTIILVHALKQQSWECNSVMTKIYRDINLGIALDHNRLILNEYIKYLSEFESFRKWISALEHGGRIHYRSGRLDSKIKAKLVKKGFHEDSDHVFVAVAINADKIIITEESDYGKGKSEKAKSPEKIEVLRHLKEDLGLNIYEASEWLDIVENKH